MRCTCGAVLPEDARFCHKCGKPQYEEDIERLKAFETPVETPVAAAPPDVPKTPAHIGFRNGKAVRITLVVAAFSLFALSMIASVAPPLALPMLIAAGFVSVRIYLIRTTESLTPSGGATLGAMTWLWLYPLEAAGTVYEFFTPQGRTLLKSAFNTPELLHLLDDPQKVTVFVVAVLLVALVLGGLFAAIGGILAVRWQPRNRPSH